MENCGNGLLMADRRIFLSYTRDEVPFVRSVAAELRKRGVDAGLKASEIEPGDLFSERLSESLRSSSLLVAFIGRAVDSPWMNFEIGAAMGQSKTVLPVFLSQHARRAAPSVVQGFQGIDASNLKPEEVADQIAEVIATAA